MARGLRAGLLLRSDLVQPGTWIPLLKAGTSLTPELIAKIRRLGLEGVALGCVEHEHGSARSTSPFFLTSADAAGIEAILSGKGEQADLRLIVNDIHRRLKRLRTIPEFRLAGHYESRHPLNVFTLALVMGTALGYGTAQLLNLGMSALFHDFGKALLPASLLGKAGPLTSQERELVRHHPALSVALLARAPRFSRWSIAAAVKEAIRHHHERLDGSGYPDGLRGPAISQLAMIIAVADTYDAMLSDRPYSRRNPPGIAYQTIKTLAGRQFDHAVVDTFLQHVIPYPAGTEVLLADRQLAKVSQSAPTDPLKPIVIVAGQELDLVECRGLDIVGVRLNRFQERVAVTVPVRVKLGGGQTVWGKTVNLSAEGACIEIPGKIEQAFDIEIQFCLGGALLDSFRGRVCWSCHQENGRTRMGLFVRKGDLISQTKPLERCVS
ncbi:MAG: HD domain-containing protein [Cyanobacteria bacterium NC_groundwater_1444_Ag_S-0.65um_54_12]|nr:HD domain-containing protein [Cyanobacteria bacterium NC_groundwater_1444_Ag_S-0.65um_54_12]